MQIRTTLLATTTLLALLFALPGQAAIKCWTNRDGIRECGNEIPPEYSQGQSETINDQGMTTKVEPRAKTADELAEEQRKKDEEVARAAEAKRKHEEQAAYDRVLLATFLTENDIVAARDRRTSAIDASVDVTKATLAKLEEKLKKQEQKNGARSTDDQRDIDSLKQQIADKQGYIAAKQQEKAATTTLYEAYIKRFRELKGTEAPK